MKPNVDFRSGRAWWASVVLFAGVASSINAADEPLPTPTTSVAAEWLPAYGEKMFDYLHHDWEGWFPGGRNNRFHDQHVQLVWNQKPISKDWQIFNRHYVFDGEWFAVEWFYRATYTDDGFREWETTLGIGRLQDGRMISWTEYFDDSVGSLQRLRLLPLFDEKEPIFPWPARAQLKMPYRP